MATVPWVVCVPGFGGSKLGWQFTTEPWSYAKPTPIFGRGITVRRTIWADPGWLATGGFGWLELDTDGLRASPKLKGHSVDAFGIIPGYYDTMHSHLLRAGFKPIWAHYDWRLRQEDAYREVLQQIEDYAEGEPVHLVGHSRGGLIAARCMKDLQSRGKLSLIKSLATFGTPWYGSYLCSPWLAGYVSIKERLIQLMLTIGNLINKEPILAQAYRAIRTHPGVYELLPDPTAAKAAGDSGADSLYDPEWWSYQAPIGIGGSVTVPLPISAAHLTAALAYRSQSTLPPTGVPWRIFASRAYPTLGGETKANFQYNFQRVGGSQEGDGVVPLWSAVPTGQTPVYVGRDHGGMVQSRTALDSLVDWLNAA